MPQRWKLPNFTNLVQMIKIFDKCKRDRKIQSHFEEALKMLTKNSRFQVVVKKELKVRFSMSKSTVGQIRGYLESLQPNDDVLESKPR